MSILYRKVLCSDRLPDDGNYHDTNDGAIYCWKGLLCNQNGPLTFTPEWWLEEVTIPTEEEIEKVIRQEYPCDHTDENEDILASVFGGFKLALEILTK